MTRRDMLKGLGGATAVAGFPTIIPARVLGQEAPSKTVQIGQIGYGRIASYMDVPAILACKGARYVAVADFDKERAQWGKERIEAHYAKQGVPGEITAVHDYRELIARKDIDAVAISTPDHWHSQPGVEAAFAGKHVYLQKPTSLTIDEGRLLSDAVRANKRTFLLGSQQRSSEQFHRACELVRNGRLGKVTRIEIGLPGDPAGGRTEKMPVPEQFNYEAWLGSTPEVYYTEDRVHKNHDRKLTSRPGWLRCEQFGAGMITGWGAHHLDIAHWGMGWETSGPKFIQDKGTHFNKFYKDKDGKDVLGLWDVHGEYDVEMTYADGTLMRVWDKFPNGIRFIGEKGWIFVSRGATKTTASDPVAPGKPLKALDASDPALLEGDAGPIKLYKHRGNHHQNWIDHILKGDEDTLVPVETAHRSCSACLLAHIGMKLKRRLEWDPVKERFVNDDEANAMLRREERAPYGTRRAYERMSGKRS
ncbi:MAG TPA: Gfo/Idh/MocA family oxidoreductase [Kiritimatiellia bacterium]|nr:Gfo/Idh/MocA family oxidoreductase [Kiritimatiellia bacterium]HRU71173.1 Gfo/Idh/MocA family oxidoreductase [Kiritimatiellia bacterium]